jgi:hypothetical protein
MQLTSSTAHLHIAFLVSNPNKATKIVNPSLAAPAAHPPRNTPLQLTLHIGSPHRPPTTLAAGSPPISNPRIRFTLCSSPAAYRGPDSGPNNRGPPCIRHAPRLHGTPCASALRAPGRGAGDRI